MILKRIFTFSFIMLISSSLYTKNIEKNKIKVILPAAEEILKKSDIATGAKFQYLEVEQTIKLGKREKSFLIKEYSVDSFEKRLLIFNQNEKEELRIIIENFGEKIFFNKKKDYIRLKKKNIKKNILKSGYSYENLISGNMSKRYKGRAIKITRFNKKKCFLLNLRPVSKFSKNTRLIIWIDTKHFLVRAIDYYRDYQSFPFKRISFYRFKKFKKIRIPTKIIMNNHITRLKTISIVKKISHKKFDLEIFDIKSNNFDFAE
jgi:outer membrane lipoprotein-sorting protein